MSYRRSGSRSKRSQQAYLSNPKAITHIAMKVDEAIDLAGAGLLISESLKAS